MIQAVNLKRLGTVKDLVLVTQFILDVFEGLLQVSRLERKERLPARFRGEISQDFVAIGFDAR